MTQVIGNEELPNNGTVYNFEGHLYGDVNVSFFHFLSRNGRRNARETVVV
jgi:hypothetical protein